MDVRIRSHVSALLVGWEVCRAAIFPRRCVGSCCAWELRPLSVPRIVSMVLNICEHTSPEHAQQSAARVRVSVSHDLSTGDHVVKIRPCIGYLGHPVRHVTEHRTTEYRRGLE